MSYLIILLNSTGAWCGHLASHHFQFGLNVKELFCFAAKSGAMTIVYTKQMAPWYSIEYNTVTMTGSGFQVFNFLEALFVKNKENMKSVVDSSVGRALSFSHEGPRFKPRRGHLFILLLIFGLIDC
jgi:hypothetical protein